MDDYLKLIFLTKDGSSTAFVYQAGHYLMDIIAPTGVRATRNEYDAGGPCKFIKFTWVAKPQAENAPGRWYHEA